MKLFISLFSLLFFTVSYGEEALVPMSVVEQNLQDYTDEEKALIGDDLSNIDQLIFRNKSPNSNAFYLGTAGGPGSCKSTILETILQNDPLFQNACYIDPDPQGLRLMINTYLTRGLSFYTISQAASFKDAQVKAYNYWRGGSNYIAQTLLNKAFKGGFNIAHGTTATSPVVEKFYKALKDKSYTITLVLCYATDETRGKTIQYRTETQANYQATPEDAIQKGKMFPERFPVYFQYADSLRLYWTDNFPSGGSKEVARIENQTLTIKDPIGYKSFVNQYEEDRKNFSSPGLSWEDLLKIQGIGS